MRIETVERVAGFPRSGKAKKRQRKIKQERTLSAFEACSVILSMKHMENSFNYAKRGSRALARFREKPGSPDSAENCFSRRLSVL